MSTSSQLPGSSWWSFFFFLISFGTSEAHPVLTIQRNDIPRLRLYGKSLIWKNPIPHARAIDEWIGGLEIGTLIKSRFVYLSNFCSYQNEPLEDGMWGGVEGYFNRSIGFPFSCVGLIHYGLPFRNTMPRTRIDHLRPMYMYKCWFDPLCRYGYSFKVNDTDVGLPR